MSKPLLASLLVAVLSACGDSGTSSGGSSPNGGAGPGAGGAGAGANGEGGNGTGAGSQGGAGVGGEAPTVPACVLTCAGPADCATPTVLTDEGNWACTASRCEYTGCQTSVECQQGLFNANYVCEPGPGGLPTCTLTCNTTADCATATALTDADNWACAQNRCQYLGCKSDSECQEALLNPAYSCVPGPLPTCVLGCATPADCVTGSVLTDADNWACEAGHCRYLGCQSATECQQGLANAGYTCE